MVHFPDSSVFRRLCRHRKRILLGISLKNGRFRRLQNFLPQKLEGFADFAEILVSTHIHPCFLFAVTSFTETQSLPFHTNSQKSAVFIINSNSSGFTFSKASMSANFRIPKVSKFQKNTPQEGFYSLFEQ